MPPSESQTCISRTLGCMQSEPGVGGAMSRPSPVSLFEPGAGSLPGGAERTVHATIASRARQAPKEERDEGTLTTHHPQ